MAGPHKSDNKQSNFYYELEFNNSVINSSVEILNNPRFTSLIFILNFHCSKQKLAYMTNLYI